MIVRPDTYDGSRTLLVTGARALADTDAAATWTWATLGASVDAFDPRFIVHGGAGRGADDVAERLAAADGRVRVRFALDGWVYRNGARVEEWATAAARALAPAQLPLARNAAMVRQVAARMGRRRTALLALFAPWSPTFGTEHTVRQAAAVGLPRWGEACPAEYGPKAHRDLARRPGESDVAWARRTERP